MATNPCPWADTATTGQQSFSHATIVTDRFHVQCLVSAAVQALRIKLRQEALKEENDQLNQARKAGRPYTSTLYKNEDTTKQPRLLVINFILCQSASPIMDLK